MLSFGDMLREVRGERSQEDVARLLGIAQVTVSAWETGTRCPSPREVPRIASALGLSVVGSARLLDAALAWEPPARAEKTARPCRRSRTSSPASGCPPARGGRGPAPWAPRTPGAAPTGARRWRSTGAPTAP